MIMDDSYYCPICGEPFKLNDTVHEVKVDNEFCVDICDDCFEVLNDDDIKKELNIPIPVMEKRWLHED